MADLGKQQARAHEYVENQGLNGEFKNTSSEVWGENQLRAGISAVMNSRQPRKAINSSFPYKELDLRGFVSSEPICHVERRQLGLRLRARLAAVDMAHETEGRNTLREIAERVGTSARTLNMQFGVKDALFAFPPPELVPVLFDCWLSAGDATGLQEGLTRAFRELDANPLARSLLMGLARLHTEMPKLMLADGYFNASLRSELVQNLSVSRSCLGWTGYITDALRDSLQEWASSAEPGLLESVVSNLMERLRPIAFL